ncbi:MAG: molybdenum cofactor guanylyltransferase [Armatimonadetes bacterium]|nr:molybdenum cofactor guanylyltransferase [Armatimonadota bacterium]
MWDNVEAVILTGGASSRMGRDKATLPILGQSQSERILDQIQTQCQKVSSIGRRAIRDECFIADQTEFAGPLVALSQFQPERPLVVLLSCDIPFFDARIIDLMVMKLEEGDDAVLVEANSRVQPLLGIYRKSCWGNLVRLVDAGETRILRWVNLLKTRTISEVDLVTAGLNPASIISANTIEELNLILGNESAQST